LLSGRWNVARERCDSLTDDPYRAETWPRSRPGRRLCASGLHVPSGFGERITTRPRSAAVDRGLAYSRFKPYALSAPSSVTTRCQLLQEGTGAQRGSKQGTEASTALLLTDPRRSRRRELPARKPCRENDLQFPK